MPWFMSKSKHICSLSPVGVCFRYVSTSFPHFLISSLDAALAKPYPGASTKYDKFAVFNFKNTSYFVLPGFLLV